MLCHGGRPRNLPLSVADSFDLDAAKWRARFEVLAAERWHVDGYDRDAARRWAYVELLVEWTQAHPDVDALPSAQAEPIARHALADLGIVPDPSVRGVVDLAAWSGIGRRSRTAPRGLPS